MDVLRDAAGIKNLNNHDHKGAFSAIIQFNPSMF